MHGVCGPCTVQSSYVNFAGEFTFAGNAKLSPDLVQDWDSACSKILHLARPILWRPSQDGGGLVLLNNAPSALTDFELAFNCISCLANFLHTQHQIVLQGEVWYQGEESLNTGIVLAHSNAAVETLPIKQLPGVAGAAACNDASRLRNLPLESIQGKDAFGRTAFMHAAKGDCWAVLQELLQHPGWISWEEKAKPNGMNSLHYLSRNPPMAATTLQYARTLQLLPTDLPKRHLNALDLEGKTPLAHAIEARNKAMAIWLLQHGADPDFTADNRPHLRPVYAAVNAKDVFFLQRLLDAGATVHVKDYVQDTPLNKALQQQHAEHFYLLILHGANLDARHARFRFGYSGPSTVRQVIQDFPEGTSGALLRDAAKKALTARRRLVVMILAARAAPGLVPDVLQLICAFAGIVDSM